MGLLDRAAARMARARADTRSQSDERLARRVAHHVERERKAGQPDQVEPAVEMGESNFATARVPYGVDLAAAWAWRILVIALALFVLAVVIGHLQVIVLPVVIALLITALVSPIVDALHRAHVPRGLASLLVVLGTLALIVLLLTVAGQQVANGANDLANQVVTGLEQIRNWLRSGPLHISDKQLSGYIQQAQIFITSGNQHLVGRLTEVGTLVGRIVAGFFIVMFSTYFFLADGSRIWGWCVRIFPRTARQRADSSGRIAWRSLTQFVRATVVVAFTDALGIMLCAAILRVPFLLAIGVLVFLGAFIPVIGATLSGSVAVIVALVAHGPIVALIMLGGVIAVQQLEAHVLQPFLMGRFVSVHPLGVIIAIAVGVVVAGIPGALVAVPFVASFNAVVLHLADLATPPREEPIPDEPPPEEVAAPELAES